MIKYVSLSIAAASVALASPPLFAQDADGKPQTNYELRYIKLAPGAAMRWAELSERYWVPAWEKAGLPPIEVHWLTEGEYDVLLPMAYPDGKSSFDEDMPRFYAALAEVAGSEKRANELRAEMTALVEGVKYAHSHTHP